MKDFSLKFVDIMIGVILGLGFQWWPMLQENWQYIAFIFAYIDVVDYWIDYSPSLKKFPPKREISVMLDLGIMFGLFLYIYSTQLTIIHLLAGFILFRILDYFWILNAKISHRPSSEDALFLNTWLKFNLIEAGFAAGGMALALFTEFKAVEILLAFVGLRILSRILASLTYKKVHFA